MEIFKYLLVTICVGPHTVQPYLHTFAIPLLYEARACLQLVFLKYFLYVSFSIILIS